MNNENPNVRKLLKPSDRRLEIVVGWICALISIAFAALLVFLLYIIGWRNPREYGSHDLQKLQTVALLAILLVMAIVFSVFASRLLRVKNQKKRLMSPFALRAWGTFFSLGSVVLLLDCVIHRRWSQIPHLWEILTGSISMAIAAFALARKWKDDDRIS